MFPTQPAPGSFAPFTIIVRPRARNYKRFQTHQPNVPVAGPENQRRSKPASTATTPREQDNRPDFGSGFTGSRATRRPPPAALSQLLARDQVTLYALNTTDSVLHDAAEARAVSRLFVADNSALANGIGCPNPTLTTQAVATRTAEKTFQRCFGGDPWVLSQARMSSVGPQATKTVTAL
jgi:hypothetical protein